MTQTRGPGLRPNRQLWLLITLLVALLTVSAVLGQPLPPRAYDLDSAEAQGLLALRLWLEEMGYRVEQGRPTADRLLDGEEPHVHLLFIYPNVEPLNAAEVAAIRRWVEAGGTLVTIGATLDEAALVDAFGVHVEQAARASTHEQQVQPLLPSAPAQTRALGLNDTLNLSEAPRAVPVLALGVNGADAGRATVAVQAVGDGWVWHLTARHDLTNATLRSAAAAQLVPALLRAVPENGAIFFDTHHLFGDALAARTVSSLWEWLYRTPSGWAVLYGTMLTFFFLLLQGKRLGPPLHIATANRPRAAAEYVRAMAGLHQRTGQVRAVAQHHSRRLKAALGHDLHIPPDIADDEFVAQLRLADHRLSAQDLQQVEEMLRTLRGDPAEGALVRTTRRVDQFLRQRRVPGAANR